jgi:hypothetical protein
MWNVDNDSMNAKRIYFFGRKDGHDYCLLLSLHLSSTLYRSRSVTSYPASLLQANKESALSSGAADLLMSKEI